MTDIIPFDYGSHRVRTIDIDGEPWFVAGDVCAVLEITDTHRAVSRLDEADRRQTPIRSGDQQRNMSLVNESGLYELIFRSDKPEARDFRRWVTREVLPTIRRTGSYESGSRDELDVLAATVAQLQQARDQAQRAHDTAERAESTATETSARLDAIEGRHDWFAALGYAKLTGLPTHTTVLAQLGRIASNVAAQHNITGNRVQHALYGEVNQWPRWIWDEAADQLGGAA